MKRTLLFASILLSGVTFSQSFDQSNEPQINDMTDFYLCDSFAVNYAGITGAGSTWDYSTILGIPNTTKSVSVIDASTSPFASDFTGATSATIIETAITTFYSSDVNGRVSQGFVYSEPTFGDVVAAWDVDAEQTHNYPMVLNDEVLDDFSGSFSYVFQSIPQNPACNGNVMTSVDGSGTLILPGPTNYTNVLRYQMIDTAYTTVLLFGDVEVIRTQFEYYDHTTSALPIFIHTTIKIQSVGSSAPITEQSLVLCKDAPLEYLGLSTEQVDQISIYPNPSNGIVTVKGKFESDASVTVSDQSGRIVHSFSNVISGQEFNLSGLNAGTYFVNVKNGGNSSVKRLVIQ